jgi:hypothetical protein
MSRSTFRTDAGRKDPDRFSETLRRFHKVLWSKPLPSGAHFHLDDRTPGTYVHHRSALGEFAQTSDAVIPSHAPLRSISSTAASIGEAGTLERRSGCSRFGKPRSQAQFRSRGNAIAKCSGDRSALSSERRRSELEPWGLMRHF